MKPPVAADRPIPAETRRQLLEAAGEVFAGTGFRDATVREICRRAGANVAAVNYHFGNKQALYLEVLRYAHNMAIQKYPPLLDVPGDAPAEQRLRAFITSFLLRIFDKGPDAWHGKLVSREMIEPTAAFDHLIEERVRPMAGRLGRIVADLLGCPVNDRRVRLCAFSIVSQCVFYHHCRPVVCRLFPKQPAPGMAGVEKLADHITKFSLAAMRHLPKTKH